MNFKKILIRVFTFLVAYLALVNVVLKNQEYYGDFNWRTSLWSDQAGYYSYNPATFIYDFEIDSFPLKAAVNTGVGFRNKNGKFFTRYTYGVAFLQSPFFLAVHYYNKSKSLDTDGFSGNYHRIPILSGVFYLMLAFIILFRILRRQYSAIVSIISLIIIFTGTNLYFYFLNYNGFSHIYSLFLFTLFSSLALKYRDKEHVFTLYLLAFIFSFCVLIRPTSIIIAVALFMFWNKNTWKSLWRNLSIIRIVILLVFAVLPFIPQFAYWYFYSGKLLYYSYGDEGFKYLFNPQLLKTWFAPKNGVLPYTPIFIPLLIIWILRLRSDKTALPTLGIFILISYFSAAWHLYHFGCGYGNRNLIEYGVFFVFPLASFINYRYNRLIKYPVYLLIILSVMVNLKLSKSYDFCFQGDEWEFKEYKKILTRTAFDTKLSFKTEDRPYLSLDSTWCYSEQIELFQEDISNESYGRCRVSVTAKIPNSKVEALMVLSLDSADKSIAWNGNDFGSKFTKINKWETFKWTFTMPKDYPKESKISFFVWAPQCDTIHIKNLKLYLE